VLFADTNPRLIRKVSPGGTISTAVGNQLVSFPFTFGDEGLPTSAYFIAVSGVALDKAGNIYATDSVNGTIRRTQPIAVSFVSNAASNLQGPVAPGEIVVLSGSGLGPPQLVSSALDIQGFYGVLSSGTNVLFNGIPAPLIYTSTGQVAAIVPYSVRAGTAMVSVNYYGQSSNSISVPVALSEPGIFTLDSTGKGQAAAVNQDGSFNGADHPAKSGDVILIFVTGEGQTDPPGVDGKPAALPLPHPNLPVKVFIDGRSCQVLYAGGAPGEVAGLMQVNVQVPSGVASGRAVPVVVSVGGNSSQMNTTIAVN
jgi:uncharacterized protein (TIGR03437 family)